VIEPTSCHDPAVAYRAVFFGAIAIGGLAAGCGDSDPAVAPPTGSGDAGVDSAPRRPRPGDPCVSRLDCDDGVFCNGNEECISGICTGPRNVACRGTTCTTSSCDEAAGGCSIVQIARCEAPCATDAECDDGRSCTRDVCDATLGCVHLPEDGRCPAVSGTGACGVGVCLIEGVADENGCGVKPDAAKCAPGESCDERLACVALPAACTRDEDCSDHSFCDGVERCVEVAGEKHCVHGVRTTCAPRDACHHATCVLRDLGDPYCLDVKLPRCP